jgi:penicillin-binding protein 1A
MKPRRGLREIVWWVLRATNLSLMFMIALTIGVVLGTYTGIARMVPNARTLVGVTPGNGSRVLSAEGELLATVTTENRQFVPLDRIPLPMQNAVVATEDRDFYRHIGVDPKGILRAAWQDLRSASARQGGSTITQQLARNLFLSQTKTVTRKLAEVILALQLERAYTKPEIMELYLNQIYFGEGAYGVEVAAKTYFGKDVWQLSIPDCALIAGLARRPEYYSPFSDAQRAVDRRATVLAQMHAQGYLSEEQMLDGQHAPLQLTKERKPLGLSSYKAPFFTNYILRQVALDYGPDALYRGDLTIQTTLNLEMQQAAEEAVAWGLQYAKGRRWKVNQVALVAVDARTGAIKAMVGGADFKQNQYNLTAQGGRQPGSSFKPFVYTAAMEAGYTPESIVVDSPVSYPGAGGKRWTPHNYNNDYSGPITFRKALAHSKNVCAVKVAGMVGIGAVIRVAERMGIYHQMEPVLSTAIGTCDVTPLEMASAYSVFATHGMRTEPYGIEKIVDARGGTVDEHTVKTWRVLDQMVADQMLDMLGDVIKYGTASAIRSTLKFSAAGKTGTSSDYKDAWFVGFTDDLSAAVWAGNEPPEKMGKVAGASLPAPTWARFMVKAQPIMVAARTAGERAPVVEISPREEGVPQPEKPPSQQETQPEQQSPEAQGQEKPEEHIVTKRICPRSGLLAGPYCPEPREVTYNLDAGSEPPTETCNIHTGPAPEQRRPPARSLGSGQARPAPARREPSARSEKVTLSVCAITGKLATQYCPIVVQRTFDADAAPTETCTRHGRRAPGP